MHANEVVLGHVLTECRTAPTVHTFDYFQSASRDLLLLSSGASEQGRAGDLAAELLQKVNAMVHSKQVLHDKGLFLFYKTYAKSALWLRLLYLTQVC